jgi:hypothetical protein
MLGVQVQVLLLLVRGRGRAVETVMLGDLLLLLTVMLGDLLLVHLLLALVLMVERTMKAAAGTQPLDEIVLVRIKSQKTGTTGTRMHHRVLVLM